MTYLDTSALVKRFVEEKGSERVAALILREGPVATAKIAYAEVFAALARKRRDGALSDRAYVRVRRAVDQDWLGYVRVNLGDEVLRRARDLVRRHPLRAYDAVHLASALELRAALDEPVTFVAADARLLEAARHERLDTLDPEA